MSEKNRYEEFLEKKTNLENDLEVLEKQIYDLESKYLEETANTGNIIKGWDGYLQLKNNQKSSQQRKVKINNADRLFSLSSLTSIAQKPEEILPEKINGTALIQHVFRPKRTKKNNKNYAKMGESKQQQEEVNEIVSSSSSDEYQNETKKKNKGIKKY